MNVNSSGGFDWDWANPKSARDQEYCGMSESYSHGNSCNRGMINATETHYLETPLSIEVLAIIFESDIDKKSTKQLFFVRNMAIKL